MTNAGWQMTNAGWRMGDDECRDETRHPRFPGARKWLARSARDVGPGGRQVSTQENQVQVKHGFSSGPRSLRDPGPIGRLGYTR
jgi:hypothetical protein